MLVYCRVFACVGGASLYIYTVVLIHWNHQGWIFVTSSCSHFYFKSCVFCLGIPWFRWQDPRQPLILGYLLGGVLVGPNLGLELVHSHESVAEIANLGLVFLLFMIGILGKKSVGVSILMPQNWRVDKHFLDVSGKKTWSFIRNHTFFFVCYMSHRCSRSSHNSDRFGIFPKTLGWSWMWKKFCVWVVWCCWRDCFNSPFALELTISSSLQWRVWAASNLAKDHMQPCTLECSRGGFERRCFTKNWMIPKCNLCCPILGQVINTTQPCNHGMCSFSFEKRRVPKSIVQFLSGLVKWGTARWSAASHRLWLSWNCCPRRERQIDQMDDLPWAFWSFRILCRFFW